jgi:hypothetical protein
MRQRALVLLLLLILKTAQEFCRGVKRDITQYRELQADKHFNSLNCGFIATTLMHHTHLVFGCKL